MPLEQKDTGPCWQCGNRNAHIDPVENDPRTFIVHCPDCGAENHISWASYNPPPAFVRTRQRQPNLFEGAP